MNLNDRIKPFVVTEYEDGGAVLRLHDVCKYKQEIFETRANDGFIGNGYDWTSLAKAFLEERMSDRADLIEFEPDASLFSAFCSELDVLEEFAEEFKDACEDFEYITDIFSRALLD